MASHPTDLLGNPQKEPHRFDRDTRKNRQGEWEPIDELILWPVILACQSQTADIEARRWLCKYLDRQAVLAGKRPDFDYAKAECSIIADRIVTRHIAGKRLEVYMLASWLFSGARTGQPITWGEYHSVLLPFKTNKNKQPRLEPEQLRKFLDRHPTDAVLIRDCVPPPDMGSVPGGKGRPARAANLSALHNALEGVRNTPLEDEHKLTVAWAGLNKVANQ